MRRSASVTLLILNAAGRPTAMAMPIYMRNLPMPAMLSRSSPPIAAMRNVISSQRLRQNKVACSRCPPSSGNMGSKLKPLMSSNSNAAILSHVCPVINPARVNATPSAMPGTGPASATRPFFHPGTFQFRPVTAAPNSGIKNIRKLR